MHIVNVKVENCVFSEKEGRFQAMLLVEGSDSRVWFKAKARASDATHSSEVTRSLMADAIRQLRRMPEYRSSKQKITWARDALHA